MRYVWSRRLEKLPQRFAVSKAGPASAYPISLLRGGFDDFSHFSRAFKPKLWPCAPGLQTTERCLRPNIAGSVRAGRQKSRVLSIA